MTKTKVKKKNPAAQALGRRGGSKNTLAQQSARRKNAKRAGRPRRICIRCNQPVYGGHQDRALDDTCGQHGWRWERAGTSHPAPPNRERVALDTIALILNEQPWTVDAIINIATVVRALDRDVIDRDVRAPDTLDRALAAMQEENRAALARLSEKDDTP